MAKLYPPIVEGTIPSFIKNSDGTINIVVPFTMNKAVLISDISNMAIKIKNILNNSSIVSNIKDIKAIINDSYNSVVFELTPVEGQKIPMNIGEHYKIQIAYIDNSEIVGYYSNITIGKCTAEPKVNINNAEEGKESINESSKYIATYSNEDTTEKVYSY